MKLKIMMLVLAFGLAASPIVFADNGEMKGAATQTAALEEVGNKICPISGEKVIPGKEAKITYKGKVYNMCCSMCEKDFKKDPEAAIKKIEAAR